MANLHATAFPADQAWDSKAFHDLLIQGSVLARGTTDGESLIAMIVVQNAADQSEILTLATHPEHRRRKLASRMLVSIEARLRVQGIVQLQLDVAEDNPGAIAFYKKYQFETDGRRPRYYKRLEGKRVDAILMSKRMARQAAT